MSEPKLIIDSDWKSAAQAEKEKLAAASAPKSAPGAEGDDERREVAFEDIVGMLANQALSFMGFIPDPYSGQAMVSLPYAKLHIDMLTILEAKTKGNLTESELAALTKILSQLRMAFVETTEAVSRAVQEGRLKPMSQQGMAGGPAAAPGATPGPAGGLVMPG